MPVPRKIVIYKKYFTDFRDGLQGEDRKKLDYVIEFVRTMEMIPKKFFKHLEGTSGLYEIRCETESHWLRVFCFFDDGNIIVLGNGFLKKSDKTPKTEIDLALKIKEAYFDEKRK